MALALDGCRVIDADTHLTEAHDLWTSRAPAKFKDRVPRIDEIDGRPMWVVDGAELGFAGGGGVIDRDGGKGRALEALYSWTQAQIHQGAYDPKARIAVMDDSGIWAQVCFPNSIGLGGQGISDAVTDPESPAALHSDLQRRHGRDSGRIGSAAAADAGAAGLGRRGQRQGGRAGGRAGPARGQYDVGPPGPGCARPGQPSLGPGVGGLRGVAHAGALPYRGQPDHHDLLRDLPLGLAERGHQAGHRRTMLFIGNARVVANIILSGMLDRHPALQMVSVESGVGWIPFILEALDYEMSRTRQRNWIGSPCCLLSTSSGICSPPSGSR